MIKTFRGVMADGAQDTILLHTNDGSTGYRIVNFQLIGKTPGSMTVEAVIKVYKVLQTTIDGTVDFSDQTLLAAGYWVDNSGVSTPSWETIIFDKEIFNQDIYVTFFDASTSENMNYYLELEQVKLDINSNTVATLKDMRNTASPNPG